MNAAQHAIREAKEAYMDSDSLPIAHALHGAAYGDDEVFDEMRYSFVVCLRSSSITTWEQQRPRDECAAMFDRVISFVDRSAAIADEKRRDDGNRA